MKASDYIVEFLIAQGISDVFGYPGGMVTHLMDSLSGKADRIAVHTPYNEQGAAFAACGYAQIAEKPGVAFATSGPGATNLITGICNAFFDNIPTVFITGQVNSFESKGNFDVRQRGFQETDIVSMVSPVTKAAIRVTSADQIPPALERAFTVSQQGRKGPVLLDITMDAFRGEVESTQFAQITVENTSSQAEVDEFTKALDSALSKSERPCILLGSAAVHEGVRQQAASLIDACDVPFVTSMLAVDISSDCSQSTSYGFIGAYGDRVANFIVAKCDLLVCLGTRLDVRQTGGKREVFAPGADILRIDIDSGEMSNKVRPAEIQFVLDIADAFRVLGSALTESHHGPWIDWLDVCDELSDKLSLFDESPTKQLVSSISEKIPADTVITTDVGQNQVWVAQAFKLKHSQRLLFSGGHGAMGYSLPAAIGAYYADGKDVYSFSGDGGLQMNIQELQWVFREQVPVKIVVFDNRALGMIRHFQEMYFEKRSVQTTVEGGYLPPDFESISSAYGIKASVVDSLETLNAFSFTPGIPEMLIVSIPYNTYVFPKLEFGKPNQDQEPLIDRDLYRDLMNL